MQGELISLPFFYGPVIIKKKNVSVFHARVWNTVFWISVPTDSGFCLTSFISQCILLSELVGWGEEAENNNPVHILLAPVLFAFSAASLRLVGPACTHHGHRPTTTCLWQTFLLFPFLIFFLIILGDDLVYQTLLIKHGKTNVIIKL